MATEKQNKATKEFRDKYEDYNGVYIYLIRCDSFYKIGIASNLESRLNTLQCGNPFELDLVWAAKIKDAIETEELLHELYKEKRRFREWFFLNEADVAYIKSLN